MPKFLEKALKTEYPGNDHAVYGTMNAIGAMHGNKTTAKGERMQAKHDAKVGSARKAPAASSGHPHKNLGAYLHKAKKR